ncbi:unnamed protein product [Toxocara canis]|uniref:Uncharacterized protein n=1 Tax=Toxocara canis TaxID=6265 RepID=A0A183UPN1_TOXCA|nr:unnamed protein product [Toxocara canis]
MSRVQREGSRLREREKRNAHLDKDGLWKCESRMKYASSPLFSYFPADKGITQLLISISIRNFCTLEIFSVLAKTHEAEYWIHHGLQTTKSTVFIVDDGSQSLSRCPKCQLIRRKVSKHPPFGNTGVDYELHISKSPLTYPG